jgi:hypothetical protein
MVEANGLLRLTKKCSASSCVSSERIATLTVCAVVPGLKKTVPVVAA